MTDKKKLLPFAMPAFEPPLFSDRVFDIRDFRAVADGQTMNTQAFREAIDTCNSQGGGTVLVPDGIWLTGAIHLRSNVRLCLEKEAIVRFSTRPEDYLPVVFTRWEGSECYNYSPLVYAKDCENIAITGEGTFDGQGKAWWHWQRDKLCIEAAKFLYHAEHNKVPLEKRVFGTEQAALRPSFIQPINCKNVLIEGISIKDGPMWTMHPVYCENIIIRNVTVKTNGPNTDGLNPDSCRNVLIEGCSFSTGDDCIAINSGKNEDAWRVGRPCENILIRNCRMENGHGGVVIGSGMSGGVRNVFVHDCFIGTDCGIRLKSKRGRGGVVENIWFEDIVMEGIKHEAIKLNMFYPCGPAAPKSAVSPAFRNISIKKVSCTGAAIGVSLNGLPEQKLKNVRLEKISIIADQGMICSNVEDLILKDVVIKSKQEPV